MKASARDWKNFQFKPFKCIRLIGVKLSVLCKLLQVIIQLIIMCGLKGKSIILNLEVIFYSALMPITIHSRWADMLTDRHTHTVNTVKVIMMAGWRTGEAFRWITLIGKHRQDTLSFSQQIKGDSTPLLPFSCHPLTCLSLSLCCWCFHPCSFDLQSLVICCYLTCPLFSALLMLYYSLLSSFIHLTLPCLYRLDSRNHRVGTN